MDLCSSARSLLLGTACGLFLQANAQITWRRTYGGFGSDHARCVRQTSDGGYIITGTAGSFGHGASDMYVVRVNEQGEPIWSRTYGGPGAEQGIACRELADGFIIAGYTSLGANGSYDLRLVRTDPAGVQLWQKDYGTSGWDLCNAFELLPDGFILGGVSYGPDTPMGAPYVVRTDLDGDTLWTRCVTGAFRAEYAGLTPTSDGGFVLVGSKDTSSGSTDAFMTKLSADGEDVWTSIFGGDSADYFSAVLERPDGGLVACGATHSWNDNLQIYIVGVHPDGELDWEERQGDVSDAAASDIRLDHVDGYVFTGYNTLNLGERDIILTTTYPTGGFRFGNNYGDGRPADGYSIDPTADGGYVVAGWSEDFGPGQRSMYVVKTDGLGQTASLNVQTYLDPLKITSIKGASGPLVYPDPVRVGGTVTMRFTSNGPCTLSLNDLQGRTLWGQWLPSQARSFNVPGLPEGMYLLTVRDRSGVVLSSPLVIER